MFGSDGFSFGDILDVVNPLHHIPVIGNLYRKISGDVIAPAMRVAGGALFGGPIGAAFAAAGVLIDGALETRQTPPDAMPTAPGGWMVAATRQPPAPRQLFSGSTGTQVAQNKSPPASSATPRRGGWMVQAAYAMADARETSGSTLNRINTIA